MAAKRIPKTTTATSEAEAKEGENEAAHLNKSERAKLERMGEAFQKIDRLLLRLAQQGLQRMSRSSADELRALEQIAHNAALISIERQIEILATHVQRYLDKDPIFRIEDYMGTVNKVWLLTSMARKRYAAGQTPAQMIDIIGEARRSYVEHELPIFVQPLGASGWVSDTDFVGITVYFFVRDLPGVIYQASNCKPCSYFGRDPQRLLHDQISEYVQHTIFDMAHGAFEIRKAKVSSDGRMSLHKDIQVLKAPYIGARAYQSISVRNWSELVERMRGGELHPIGGTDALLVYVEPAIFGQVNIDDKNACATIELMDERGAIMYAEIPLKAENNLLIDNLQWLINGKKSREGSSHQIKRGIVSPNKPAGPSLRAPNALFGRATIAEGRLKLFPITALYDGALVYNHGRRVNELHLTLEDVSNYSLSEN